MKGAKKKRTSKGKIEKKTIAKQKKGRTATTKPQKRKARPTKAVAKPAHKTANKSRKVRKELKESSYIYHISLSPLLVLVYDIKTKAMQQIEFTPDCKYQEASSCLIGSTIYFTGGRSENIPALAAAFRLALLPSSTFSSLRAMRMARYQHSLCECDNGASLLAIGGRGNQPTEVLSCCEKFVDSRNEWVKVGPLITARACAAACYDGNSVYVFGGLSPKSKGQLEVLKTIEVLMGDGWAQIVMSFSEPANQWPGKVGAEAFSVGSELIILGGTTKPGTTEGAREVYVWDTDDEIMTKYDDLCDTGEDIVQRSSLKVYRDKLFMIAGDKGGIVSLDFTSGNWTYSPPSTQKTEQEA